MYNMKKQVLVSLVLVIFLLGVVSLAFAANEQGQVKEQIKAGEYMTKFKDHYE